jgi:hypothetical protein
LSLVGLNEKLHVKPNALTMLADRMTVISHPHRDKCLGRPKVDTEVKETDPCFQEPCSCLGTIFIHLTNTYWVPTGTRHCSMHVNTLFILPSKDYKRPISWWLHTQKTEYRVRNGE